MKVFLIAAMIFCFGAEVFSQATEKPTEVTAEIKQKINSEIEKEVARMKARMEKDESEKIDIEFAVDTLRIELYARKYMDFDYSTLGMNTASFEAKEKYDKLLNKYYQKLTSVLKKEDRQILIETQRAWISYRDNEIKLVGLLAKEEYSGGGTIQSLNYSLSVLGITQQRVIDLFNHYRWTQGLANR